MFSFFPPSEELADAIGRRHEIEDPLEILLLCQLVEMFQRDELRQSDDTRQIGEMPELAAGFIRDGLSPDQVRDHITELRAEQDEAIGEIRSYVLPDQGICDEAKRPAAPPQDTGAEPEES